MNSRAKEVFIQVFNYAALFLLFFWLIVDQGLRITVTLRRLIGVTTACSYEHLALRGVPTLLEHLAPWGVTTVLQRCSHTWVFTLGFFWGGCRPSPPHQRYSYRPRLGGMMRSALLI